MLRSQVALVTRLRKMRESDEFSFVTGDECELSTTEPAVECHQCSELKQRIKNRQKKLSWWKRTKKQLRDQVRLELFLEV